jgi:hypothetical protein
MAISYVEENAALKFLMRGLRFELTLHGIELRHVFSTMDRKGTRQKGVIWNEPEAEA